MPFIVGTLLFVAGLLLAGLALTMPLLIVGRAVQGLGSGVIGAVVYIIVGRGYEAEARPRMLAIISSAWVVPGMVGPGLAGIITEHIGWRWVFLGLTPLPLVAALMALPSLRRLAPAPQSFDIDDHRARNNDVRMALVLATGAAMTIGGLGQLSVAPVAGVALVVAGAIITVVALRNILPPGTLRAAPGLPAVIAAMGLLNLSFFGVDAFVPLTLTAVRGLSVVLAGLALTAATLTWTAGAWMQARLVRRHPPGLIAAAGLFVMLIGIARRSPRLHRLSRRCSALSRGVLRVAASVWRILPCRSLCCRTRHRDVKVAHHRRCRSPVNWERRSAQESAV